MIPAQKRSTEVDQIKDGRSNYIGAIQLWLYQYVNYWRCEKKWRRLNETRNGQKSDRFEKDYS